VSYRIIILYDNLCGGVRVGGVWGCVCGK
jgi:hypothetical protein